MKSIIKYIGAKNIDLSTYNINQYNIYCEPFGGSFTTGLNLLDNNYMGTTVYNDLDKELIIFWECLMENYRELYNSIKIVNNNLHKFIDYNISHDKYIRAATKYIICQCTTLKGVKLHTIDISNLEIKLLNISILLNSSKTQIYSKDFKEIIEEVNNFQTFMLVDPPYECKGMKNYYVHHEINHLELRDTLIKFKGKWVLTVNDCKLFRELYNGFHIQENTRTVCHHKYTELYITNT